MGGLIAAWLTGEGLIIYRSVKVNHAPPGPGQLMVSSGIFVLLGLLAESERARSVAVTLAWGYNVAAFMNLFGAGKIYQTNTNWPPSLAPNTVVIPNGKGSGAASNASPASNATSSTTGTVQSA